ncbi:MAG: hypothetical protein JWO57_2478 [Pseudonocardiales bacterium]|nr:hypothetical protein [Pseudonocardiales bacterium]
MEFPSLLPQEEELIRAAVRRWARAHPQPEGPLLTMLDGSVLTVRDAADALDYPDAPRGRTLLRMFAVAIRGAEMGVVQDQELPTIPIEEVVAAFEADVNTWGDGLRA